MERKAIDSIKYQLATIKLTKLLKANLITIVEFNQILGQLAVTFNVAQKPLESNEKASQ